MSSYMAGHEPRIIVEEVLNELAKARHTFPRQNLWITLVALMEEVGELSQACLQYNYQPEKGKSEKEIREEAIQVAVVAIRVALDCEHKVP